jgi:hypothetical protein
MMTTELPLQVNIGLRVHNGGGTIDLDQRSDNHRAQRDKRYEYQHAHHKTVHGRSWRRRMPAAGH